MSHSYNNPEVYRNNNQLQFDFAMKALSHIVIRKSDKILDIGCGDGLITSKLAQATDAAVIGTDISEQMISHASKVYANHTNLTFMCMDASRNTFKNEFDLITSFNALHWVKDQVSALEGIANAAASKANILLLLSHKKSLYHHTLDAVCSSPSWSKYFTDYINPRSFYDCDTYGQMLTQAGLQVTSLIEEEMTYYFDSPEMFKGFLQASMANIKVIPNNELDSFLEDFLQTYKNNLGEFNTHRIPLSFWCLKVQAIKN